MAIMLNTVKVYGKYIVKIENNLIIDLFAKYVHVLLKIVIFLLLYWLSEKTKSKVSLECYIYLVHQFLSWVLYR